MSKRQIRLTQDGIRRMISEAIKSYSFNGEGFNDEPDDKFDALGNPRYSDGVFSTDSEEGEAFKDRAKSYEKPNGDEVIWNQRERKLKDAEDNVTGAKWADTYDSLWDTDKKLDKMARDEFGDEEKEGQLYDKPFGDLDDVENQWEDEPGYEEEDDDENIAGLNEGKVTLTEEGLRKFISYSVANLLKEANLGITTHFDGKPSFEPENPYKDMTWDEYCEAKRMEHEKDQMRSEEPEKDEKPNLGITTHFDGKKHEETPEDIERDEHMFDDQYWVDKMNLSNDDLNEMVRKAVKGVLSKLGQ